MKWPFGVAIQFPSKETTSWPGLIWEITERTFKVIQWIAFAVVVGVAAQTVHSRALMAIFAVLVMLISFAVPAQLVGIVRFDAWKVVELSSKLQVVAVVLFLIPAGLFALLSDVVVKHGMLAFEAYNSKHSATCK